MYLDKDASSNFILVYVGSNPSRPPLYPDWNVC